jgi:Golgi apparatus protein 1
MTARTLNLAARLLLFFLVFLAPPAFAEQTVGEFVSAECKEELAKYCSSVTPGRARYAGCLLAHNDKLSEQCEFAFEVGLVQLTIILSTVNHVIDQCYADIDEHCEGVVVGGGRISQCLSKNMDKLQPDCKASFVEAREDLQ